MSHLTVQILGIVLAVEFLIPRRSSLSFVPSLSYRHCYRYHRKVSVASSGATPSASSSVSALLPVPSLSVSKVSSSVQWKGIVAVGNTIGVVICQRCYRCRRCRCLRFLQRPMGMHPRCRQHHQRRHRYRRCYRFRRYRYLKSLWRQHLGVGNTIGVIIGIGVVTGAVIVGGFCRVHWERIIGVGNTIGVIIGIGVVTGAVVRYLKLWRPMGRHHRYRQHHRRHHRCRRCYHIVIGIVSVASNGNASALSLVPSLSSSRSAMSAMPSPSKSGCEANAVLSAKSAFDVEFDDIKEAVPC